MAHLVKLAQPKCRRCSKAGKVEVFNSANGSLGVHCTPCGKSRLAEIKRSEGGAP